MRWLGRTFAEAVSKGDLGVAVTGAGSWLGHAFLALLADEGAISARARLRLFGQSARPVVLAERTFDVETLAAAPALAGGPWLLLHFAFLGKERTADLAPAAFAAANNAVLADVLRIADGACDLRVIFTSSGAVYRRDRTLLSDIDESPYGWCKVSHEARLTAWCGARSVPLVMPRVFNIGGPFINKVESYALSSFILSARRTGTIGINAARPTWRSFVHVDELLGAVCDAALGQSPERPFVFDTAGVRAVEMAELADTVARSLSPLPVRIVRPPLRDSTLDQYVGDDGAYRTLLAQQGRGIVGLETIVRDTDAYLVAGDRFH